MKNLIRGPLIEYSIASTPRWTIGHNGDWRRYNFINGLRLGFLFIFPWSDKRNPRLLALF
jgi:hypothetical protein